MSIINSLPNIEQESYGGTSLIPLSDRLFSKNKIFITGKIDETKANEFVMKIMELSESSEEIDLYINTPGGEVNSGLLIYDCIQALKDKVTINLYCIGKCFSMGAIILAGGQKGHRFILPHSEVMIHEPLLANGIGGSASSIKETADSILETKHLLEEILSKHTNNKSLKVISKEISYDHFMNAKEAIEFGIADEIKYPF